MAKYYGHTFGLNEQDEKKLQELIAKGKKVIEIVRRGIEEFIKEIKAEKNLDKK
jgi:hypothetical protein